MTPTKILIGQAILVIFIIAAAMVVATQFVAAQFGFDRALGSPWFFAGGFPIYYPWRLFEWWYAYEAYAPDIFMQGGAIAASGGMLGAAAAIAGSLMRARQSRSITTYGSARWATDKEIKAAGLLGDEGVFLGRWGKCYLRHSGPEHVMAFAPTRSGKGVGLVIPTLLSWTGSAVIHDIKGENWKLTAGWRSKFSHCLLFDPTDPASARYNPLLEIRKGEGEVRDAQNIADILIDPRGGGDKDSHWDDTARAFLVGVIIHVLYAEKEKTLAGVAAFMSDPSRTIERTLSVMLSTNHVGTKDAPRSHPQIGQTARAVMSMKDPERSGVLSTARRCLSLYLDPIAAKVTSGCDWRVTDLMEAEHPVSLYLVVPPSDISRTRPLMRLILNQIGRRLTEKLDPNPQRKLLFMLDEFPALGRLDFFETALAFLAGYGIRAYLIAQSLNQIEKAYGPNNSILDNCHVRVAFAANDDRTARRISDSLGTATELRSQRNYAGHRLAPWLSHVMVSRQETARPLLTPGEVMQLPQSQTIAMIAGLPPIRATKLKYFRDRNFRNRILPAPTVVRGSPYPDAPAARADDWSGLMTGPDARLEQSWFEQLHANGEGGHGREPGIEGAEPNRDAQSPRESRSNRSDDPNTPERQKERAREGVKRAAFMDRDPQSILPGF